MSGLTGHIDHLYEDPDLTLEDLVRIYRSIAENRPDIKIYEKVDGYNIYLSYSVKDKKARLLRNNSQIKTGGISLEDLKNEFTTARLQSGKSAVPANVVSTYSNLIGFFEKIVANVFSSEDNLKQIFGEDKSGNPQFFFNAELLDPSSPNVIKYSRKLLIFHKLGNVKIDSNEGKIVASDTEEVNERFRQLGKIFGRSNAENGIEITEDRQSKIDSVNRESLDAELSGLRGEFKKFNLDMNDSVGKYFIAGIEKYLKDKKYTFDSQQTEFIVKSILSVGFGSKHLKKPRINEFFTTNSMYDSGKIKELTNEEPAREIFKSLRAPLEQSIFRCSSVLLDKYESVYVANNKQTADDIISLINKSIEGIKSNGTQDEKKRLNIQLDKLRNNNIGFTDLINNPVEGVVFRYKDHTYKITSSFGPVNQIVNMNKFSHRPLNESKEIEANAVKVLFAGSFKPPHKGHLEVIKNFIKLPELNRKNFKVEKVIVIMGNKARSSLDKKEFGLEQSYKLFKLYLRAAGLEELVDLRITKRDNPVKDVYDYIANENNDLDKAQPGDVILLGVSAKDRGYYSNLSKFVKDKPWQVLFGTEYEVQSVFKNDVQREQDILGEYSARDFREAISNNNIKEINSFLPTEVVSSQDLLNQAYSILGVQNKVEQIKESTIVNLINNKVNIQPNSPKLNLNDLINRVNSIYINK